jgi:predicted nucleotidyltransferase component of viral defense system
VTAERYIAQVQLLMRAIPEIDRENMFALKGGTAINLFVRELPRLSVDLDLVYLPVADRDSSLGAVRDGLARIGDQLERRGLDVARQLLKDGKRLVVSEGTSAIKIEVSPVLRGTVFEPERRSVSTVVQDRFGFAEMQLVSNADLYAGKIAAALDRQHPRDLFDVFFLFENGGIDDDLFRAFLIYLVSHDRPAVELLDPNRQDIALAHEHEFMGMTIDEIPLETLLETRERLIGEIQERARHDGPKRFLTTFNALAPDWASIGFDEEIGELPAIRWKLLNLEKLRENNLDKFKKELDRLTFFLVQENDAGRK